MDYDYTNEQDFGTAGISDLIMDVKELVCILGVLLEAYPDRFTDDETTLIKNLNDHVELEDYTDG
jgi:hypothetical protein